MRVLWSSVIERRVQALQFRDSEETAFNQIDELRGMLPQNSSGDEDENYDDDEEDESDIEDDEEDEDEE